MSRPTTTLDTTQEAALDALVANQRAVDEAIAHLFAAARTCRDLQVPYSAMGARLGTSRQAAWERFSQQPSERAS